MKNSSPSSATLNSNVPITEKGRIELLDALRGFALLGIALANVRWLSGWDYLEPKDQINIAGAHNSFMVNFVHYALVDGKFYTIFAFLFGIGISLQVDRKTSPGDTAAYIFVRRMFVLLLVGLTHLILIWPGDILTFYALCGLLVFSLRKRSDEILFLFAAAMLSTPILGYIVFWQFNIPADLGFIRLGDLFWNKLGGPLSTGKEIDWIGRSDFGSFFIWTVSGAVYRIGELLQYWTIPKVIGLMTIGMLLGRRILYEGKGFRQSALLKFMIVGLLIAVPSNLSYALLDGIGEPHSKQGLVATINGTVGEFALAMVYVCAICIAWPRAYYDFPLITWFSAAGRLALTNYLMQSILGIVIFSGIGFGLVGRVGGWSMLAIAIVLFSMQVIASHLEFPRFRGQLGTSSF